MYSLYVYFSYSRAFVFFNKNCIQFFFDQRNRKLIKNTICLHRKLMDVYSSKTKRIILRSNINRLALKPSKFINLLMKLEI